MKFFINLTLVLIAAVMTAYLRLQMLHAVEGTVKVLDSDSLAAFGPDRLWC